MLGGTRSAQAVCDRIGHVFNDHSFRTLRIYSSVRGAHHCNASLSQIPLFLTDIIPNLCSVRYKTESFGQWRKHKLRVLYLLPGMLKHFTQAFVNHISFPTKNGFVLNKHYNNYFVTTNAISTEIAIGSPVGAMVPSLGFKALLNQWSIDLTFILFIDSFLLLKDVQIIIIYLYYSLFECEVC